MESEGPAATLSLQNLGHPELRYDSSDYDPLLTGSPSAGGIRCSPLSSGGLAAPVNGFGHHGEPSPSSGTAPLDTNNGGPSTAASSPVTGTTDEPMETTSESEPERSHSSYSEALCPAESPVNVAESPEAAAVEPDSTALAEPSSVEPKLICNPDGVLCWINRDGGDVCDQSNVWPTFSSSFIHDATSSSMTAVGAAVPTGLFPFHFVAAITTPTTGTATTGRSTVQFFVCSLPAQCLPAPIDVLDLYQNLPFADLSTESQSSSSNSTAGGQYACLLCGPPRLFSDQSSFLDHAHAVHHLPPATPPSGDIYGGALLQLAGVDRNLFDQLDSSPPTLPVISWLKPIELPETLPVNQRTPVNGTDWPVLSFSRVAEAVGSPPARTTPTDDLNASVSQADMDDVQMRSEREEPDPAGDVSDREDGEVSLRICLDESAGSDTLPVRLDENGHDDSDSLHSLTDDLTFDHADLHDHHHHYHLEEGALTNGHGKSSSIECPKCDIVLGSSKSLGGHMTMVHSRNSSKTLKCPKCNWHYKYQETLEIHMKEKHPESEETCPYCLTGQAHPRLARGEVYSCGYKPYRCDICNYSTTSKGNLTIHMQSDKHVNNVQERHKNGGDTGVTGGEPSSPVEEMQPAIPRSASTSSTCRASFRCDMCGYETNVSRNLRIHMTSEKHQQNASMFLQARLQEINMHSAAAQASGMSMLDQAAMMQLMGMNPSDLMTTAYRSSATAPTSAMASAGSEHIPAVPKRPKIPDNALAFQCLICMNFMTNSMEELHEHATRDRSDPRIGGADTTGEGNSADSTVGIVNGQSYCKCCQYTTKLKANFQLHCKTDKHLQKIQLVNHVREGGPDNVWRLPYLNTSNPVQVRCNACDYQTSGLSQLRGHTESSPNHELNLAALQRVVQFSQQPRQPQSLHLDGDDDRQTSTASTSSSSVNGPTASSALISSNTGPTSTRKLKLFCSLCNFSHKSQSQFMQHIRGRDHLTHWKQYAKTLFPGSAAGGGSDLTDLAFFISVQPITNHVTDLASNFDAAQRNGGDRTDVSDEPDVDDSEGDDDLSSAEGDELREDPESVDKNLRHRLQEGVIRSQSSKQPHQPVFVCPLCQEPAKGKDILEAHLIGKHNVQAADALERLMMLVETSDIWTHGTSNLQSRDSSPVSSDAGSDKIVSSNSDTSDIYRCQKCAVTFSDIEKLFSHHTATGHLQLKQTPRGPGYLCWQKGCNQYFKSETSVQMHFREIHVKKGERSHESGEFWDEATDENSQSGEAPAEGDDELNSQTLAENGYSDHCRKFKCHRCKVAFTKQIYLTTHNKTLQHRKGGKNDYSLEKYLDPNRPHKCDICKESFTQKNILLVHYNSVSHLHKKKKYQSSRDRLSQATSEAHRTPPMAHPSSAGIAVNHQKLAGSASDNDSKPFRCRVCQIGYPNSSSLDIHFRSVGHQARVERAANTAAQSDATNVVDLSKPDHDESSGKTSVEKSGEAGRVNIKSEKAFSTSVQSSPERNRTDAPDSTSDNTSATRPRVFGRTRGNIGMQSMMESIGMEMVEHYLENNQKVARKPKDTTMEPVEGENKLPTSTAVNECPHCHKVFSTPWILKVHRESAHADIVSVKLLDTVASEYRKFHSDKAQQKRLHQEQTVTKPNSVTTNSDSSVKKKPMSPQPQPTPTTGTPATTSAANQTYNAADLLAAQMQLFLYPGLAMNGLNMMGMQAAMMNLQPPLMTSSGQYNMNLALDRNSSNSQAAASSARQALMDAQSGQKRNRTRITDEQLQILRGHFDIRNPPSDELQQKLCEQTGLDVKVVKHWYRNTLFKERQRNKDSPYNFSVPPNPLAANTVENHRESGVGLGNGEVTESGQSIGVIGHEDEFSDSGKMVKREPSVESMESRPSFRESSMTYNPLTPSPTPMQAMSEAMRDERNTGKRANRTRFTDFQVKALQDYFDKNPYPKDDDLEELSRILDLSPRVITVWFQNARQKARKSYENTTEAPPTGAQPPAPDDTSLLRAPSLTYQCKNCLQVYQRYYELIRHQKSQCSGTSAGLPNGPHSGGKEVDDTSSVHSGGESVSSSYKTEQPSSSQLDRAAWDPTVPSVSSMLSSSSFMFPGLYPPNSPFGVLQMEAISSAGPVHLASSPPIKRRVSSDDEDEESPSNKRVRTTIQPEQLDYLYQQYRVDSNPSRKQLEYIATKTNLKKRVVQVWYQNTRARERKGQLNLHQMAISKRCPVCRLHFSVRAALETHISVKHADVYCKNDINIDDLPDTPGESEDEHKSSTSSPVPQKRRPSPQPSVPSVTSMNESMKHYYENMMRKASLLQTNAVPTESLSLPILSDIKSIHITANGAKRLDSAQSNRESDVPLDLSAPHLKTEPISYFGSTQYMNETDNSRSFAMDEDGSDDEQRSMSSNTLGGGGGSRAGKRFRTQMSNAQLKVMKRLFTEYKTPTMGECELVGREIGLPKRVVQVWFQNARAKEKKNRASGIEPEKAPTTDHCPLCNVEFNAKLTLQDHLFTKRHIELLKQSEDCHDGPLPTSMLGQLTPLAPATSSRNVTTKRSVDTQERVKSSVAEPSGSRKAGGSSATVKSEPNAAGSAGLGAMTQMGPFGDLGAMMMSDPSVQMAYMYAAAGMNPYYNAAAMLNPYAGLGGFYDPAVIGTNLQMLQLPPGVIEMIFAKLSTSDRGNGTSSAVAFAQDGKRLSDLRECISPADFACATSSQTDIGSVCRKCQMVFPTEANCKAHQASICYPGTKDVKNVLKLQQIHFHCSACQKQYATIADFKTHCNSSSHQKNRHNQATPSFKRNQSNAGLGGMNDSGQAKKSRQD